MKAGRDIANPANFYPSVCNSGNFIYICTMFDFLWIETPVILPV
jgi:hypothetical protein